MRNETSVAASDLVHARTRAAILLVVVGLGAAGMSVATSDHWHVVDACLAVTAAVVALFLARDARLGLPQPIRTTAADLVHAPERRRQWSPAFEGALGVAVVIGGLGWLLWRLPTGVFGRIGKAFTDGGWSMWIILLWSVFLIAIIVERAVYLWTSSISGDAFLGTMQKYILAGDVQKAVKMCSAVNVPLTRIVQAGLLKVDRPDEEVQAALDEAALRELPKISQRTSYLALFSNISMLTGLAGTIVGLVQSFAAVSKPGVDPARRAALMAEGISRAMNSTAFGLMVAIVGLVAFSVLNGRTQALEDDINEASVRVLELVGKVQRRGAVTA